MTKIRNTCLLIGVVAAHFFMGWWLSQSAITPPEVLDEDGQSLVFVDVSGFQLNVESKLKPALPPQNNQQVSEKSDETIHNQKQAKLLTSKAVNGADVLIKKPIKEKPKKKVKKKKTTRPVKKQKTVKKEILEKNKKIENSDAPKLTPLPNANTATALPKGSGVANDTLGQSKKIGQGQGVTGRNQGASMVKASASSCTPNYPDIAKENEEEGVVTLTLTIASNGQTRGIKILKTSGFSRLDRSAMNAMKRCLFNPALKNGKPVDVAYTQKIRFSLDDERATLN